MTSEVVSVGPDMPTREIARLLAKHGISGVPVVDQSGVLLGMVSEGDLIGRTSDDRDRRRDWWLTLFSETPFLSADAILALAKLFSKLNVRERRASEIMSSPVIAVDETAEMPVIAGLLHAHKIKRVPVLRDGNVVGIVSRADLIRAMASADVPRRAQPRHASIIASWFNKIDRRFAEVERTAQSLAAAQAAKRSLLPQGHELDAEEFRKLVAEFETEQTYRKDEERRVQEKVHAEKMKALIGEHISEQRWRTLLRQAREAAARGETEFLLLRFPHDLCADGGRAINALTGDANWPQTLRGEAAEVYLRWELELKRHGFQLAARVLDFPGGVPGDIGLFLVWGE